MERDSRASRKHANGWITVTALSLLAAGLLACLYVLIGFPAVAQDVTAPGSATAACPAGMLPHSNNCREFCTLEMRI